MTTNEIAAPFTAEQTRRIVASITETRRIIAKEMAYSADLRNHGYIAQYQATLARLLAYIN